MRAFPALVGAIALFTVVGTAAALQEVSSDHPSIPKFPGYSAVTGVAHDFGSYDFDLGNEKTKHVEGKTWSFEYQIDEGKRAASPLELLRNYGNAFKAHGGKIVMQQMGNGGGEATISMPNGGGETWLHLGVNNNGEQYMLDIVETAPMEQKIEISADEMAAQLASSGHIALYGIHFATAKAEITADSAAVLDEVSKLLKKEPGLKLTIEGHTDNVGQKAANLDLSKRRAAAVKAALVERGVAASRLSTDGFGDTKPVSDNKSEDGRAKNRRVELVKS